jgi:hypothetical protein
MTGDAPDVLLSTSEERAGASGRDPRRRPFEAVACVATICLLSIAAGVMSGIDLVLLSGVVAVALVAVLCFVGPKCRLVICVAGALIVFQSTYSVLKYAYLALAILCFLLSLGGVRAPDATLRKEFRPLVLASLGLAAFLLLSSLVARANGTPLDLWFRDALPYFLMTMLPFVGIAAGERISQRWNHIWIILLGLVVSVGITADWLDRREVSALPFGRFVLSSATVVALCFAYAVVLAGRSRGLRQLGWGAVAAVIIVATILPGTRTNLLLLVAAVGVVGAVRKAAVPLHRAVALTIGIVAALILVAPPVARLVVADPQFFDSRVEAALNVLTGDPDSDGSYSERKQSYELTAEAFFDNPILGTGPGFLYPAPQVETFNLDAPGIVPAKFGIVGICFIAAFLWSVAVAVRRLRRRHGPFPAYTAARGWALVLVALLPFGPWLEDKGFGIAVAVLLASVVAESSGRANVGRASTAGAEGRSLHVRDAFGREPVGRR